MTEKNRSSTPIYATTLIAMVVAAIAIVAWMYSSDSTEQSSAAPDPVTSTVTATILQSPSSSAAPVGEHCEPALFQSMGHEFVDTLLYCEDGWARGGKFQTDYVRNFQWFDEAWHEIGNTGTSFSGFPCYDVEALRQSGAPEALLKDILDCQDNPTEVPNTYLGS